MHENPEATAVAAAAAHEEQLVQYGKLQVKLQVQMGKEVINSHYAELAKQAAATFQPHSLSASGATVAAQVSFYSSNDLVIM
jgi:hypothetical protein